MEKSKNFFAGNLKFLRERRKMTQQDLAGKLSATRSKVNALESGQTKSPTLEDFLSVSELFGISIDSLIRVELSKLGELKLRELEAGNDVYIKGGNLRVLAISVDRNNNENVEYVPVRPRRAIGRGTMIRSLSPLCPNTLFPICRQAGRFGFFLRWESRWRRFLRGAM
jgi:transcriptional regulator with XRE-family HTH domain